MQKGMSALPPIATAKANSRKKSCLLYSESDLGSFCQNYYCGLGAEATVDLLLVFAARRAFISLAKATFALEHARPQFCGLWHVNFGFVLPKRFQQVCPQSPILVRPFPLVFFSGVEITDSEFAA